MESEQPCEKDRQSFDDEWESPLKMVTGTCASNETCWNVLNEVSGEDAVCREKVRQNPAIALAICLSLTYSKADLKRLLRLSDSEILQTLAYPPYYEAIFQKMRAPSLNWRMLCEFRRSVTEYPDYRQKVLQTQRINEGALAILLDPIVEPLAAAELLDEVGQSHDEDKSTETAKRLRSIITFHQILHHGKAVPQFKSIEETKLALNSLEQQARGQSIAIEMAFRPPLPGTEEIIPLNSPDEIKKAAEAVDGSMSSEELKRYVDRVALKQDLYLYKVELTKTVRAIISLKHDEGSWNVDEFTHNGFPDIGFLELEMNNLIQEWLSTHSNAK